ncbi:MAG: phosphate acetyltransferase [Verrucomicrobia bacterium]|jgi:phosphate acetyltransferase|nr:phosphate acetyltransferase [Verrucomicrobiota bacterium]
MSLISRLSARLQNHPKRVVFPEGADPRIIQAARQFVTKKLGVPILIGDRQRIKITAARLNISLEGIRVIEPERSDEIASYVEKLESIQRYGNTNLQGDPRELVKNPSYFACLMVASAGADALISGATTHAASGLRAILQTMPRQAGVETVSSMQILESEEARFGCEGVLFLADCGVIPEPTAEQLADIAVTTAGLAGHLTNTTPKVALLAYSTHSANARLASIKKVQSATEMAKRKARELGIVADIDGEMQADAALNPFAAESKEVTGSVAGKASVLIFPDLNSGNIASKMAQHIADIPAYGQILTGLERPAAEISRGASAHDIFGTAVIVAAQAVDKSYLYPTRKDGPSA